jgi:preprotein translocase subunit SecG
MNILLSLILVAQVLSALGVIVLVLLQHGKGADMGAAFGSGASGSLFGATGSANFLSRSTGVLAAVFFASTLAISIISSKTGTVAAPKSVMDQVPAAGAPAGVGAIPGAAPAAGDSVPAASGAAPAASGTAAPASGASGNAASQKATQSNEIPK